MYKDGTKLNTLSVDFKTGKIVKSKSEVFRQNEPRDFYKVRLKNGKEIICSLDHKLFVRKKNKIIQLRLNDIKVGDKLCLIKQR